MCGGTSLYSATHVVQYSALFLWQLVLVHVLIVLLWQLGDPDQKYAHIEEIYTIDYYDMQCVYIVYNSALHCLYISDMLVTCRNTGQFFVLAIAS